MKISEVLIKSQNIRNQIVENLVTKEDGKICGYCALGALACEKGLIFEEASEYAINNIDYMEIIRSYGVNPLTTVKMPSGDPCYKGMEYNLATAIHKLNDIYEWSFERIGKWIEKLEKKGVIKYEA